MNECTTFHVSDTHLSLVINVDPLRPLSLPEPLGFLGPDHSEYVIQCIKLHFVLINCFVRSERAQKESWREFCALVCRFVFGCIGNIACVGMEGSHC